MQQSILDAQRLSFVNIKATQLSIRTIVSSQARISQRKFLHPHAEDSWFNLPAERKHKINHLWNGGETTFINPVSETLQILQDWGRNHGTATQVIHFGCVVQVGDETMS